METRLFVTRITVDSIVDICLIVDNVHLGQKHEIYLEPRLGVYLFIRQAGGPLLDG